MTEAVRWATVNELTRQFREGNINLLMVSVPRYIEVKGLIDLDALAAAVLNKINEERS